MTDKELLDFILTVLRTMDRYEMHEFIYWTCDCDGIPVQFSVNCNDLFWWGCGDSEPVIPGNVHELDRAFADCKAADPEDCAARIQGYALFCCRMRKMRPQGCCYPDNKKLWPLFDACGPERQTGLGNPYPPGGKMNA